MNVICHTYFDGSSFNDATFAEYYYILQTVATIAQEEKGDMERMT